MFFRVLLVSFSLFRPGAARALSILTKIYRKIGLIRLFSLKDILEDIELNKIVYILHLKEY